MKMSKILSLLLVVVMLVMSMTACLDTPTPDPGPDPTPDPDPVVNPLAGTYEITIWCSEITTIVEQFKQQVEAFNAANPGIVIVANVEGVSEGDAASQVITDIATAPDMFCFAQDQLARLVQASALAAPSETVAAELKATNDTVSISAASVAGTVYAYPLTSDNGYYLYYDKELITNPGSLEDIIAACENSGKKFYFDLGTAWYVASFFFATGCHSNWTTDTEGNFTSIDDNFNSANGMVAMKGMQKVVKSTAHVSSLETFENAGAIVSGTWDSGDAKLALGNNYAATKLPSFTVDGQSYQLGSYSGNKLLGIKPQADEKRALVLSLLAQYLTGAECQLQRYQLEGWGPSNLEAQADENVKNDEALTALAAQNEFAIPQGNIHGSWWDIAKVLATDAKAATNDADLQASLDTYTTSIEALFQMTDEQKSAWSVIGTVCGTNWDTDLPMTEVSDGVYESAVLTLTAGEQYKCRQGASWSVNFGSDGNLNGPNCEVEASGNYIVRLTILSETNATIELIPQN